MPHYHFPFLIIKVVISDRKIERKQKSVIFICIEINTDNKLFGETK